MKRPIFIALRVLLTVEEIFLLIFGIINLLMFHDFSTLAVAIMLAVSLLILTFVIPAISSIISYKQHCLVKKAPDASVTVSFYDDRFIVCDPNNDKDIVYAYGLIKRVVVMKEYIFLILPTQITVIIAKNGFSLRNADLLLGFLKDKRANQSTFRTDADTATDQSTAATPVVIVPPDEEPLFATENKITKKHYFLINFFHKLKDKIIFAIVSVVIAALLFAARSVLSTDSLTFDLLIIMILLLEVLNFTFIPAYAAHITYKRAQMLSPGTQQTKFYSDRLISVAVPDLTDVELFYEDIKGFRKVKTTFLLEFSVGVYEIVERDSFSVGNAADFETFFKDKIKK